MTFSILLLSVVIILNLQSVLGNTNRENGELFDNSVSDIDLMQEIRKSSINHL